MSQLDLFGAPASKDVGPAAPTEEVRGLVDGLPDNLYMGTSSWSFPGWKGIVYDADADERQLARQGLAAYGKHPLFRSVGIDRSYYAPLRADELAAYARVVSPDFRFLVKAHVDCTRVRWPNQAAYGAKAGSRSERFLDPWYAKREVVAPYVEGLGPHGGVLLFQFPPQNIPGGPRAFVSRLAELLRGLPAGPVYAFELRNPELMTPGYHRVLRQHGAVHCLTAHPSMPPIEAQYEATGGPDRRALVIRWMLARGRDYRGAKVLYAPFDRLVEADLVTRGKVVDLIQSTPRTAPAYLIVNNKAEGSSPLSIIEVARLLVRGGS